MNIKLSELDYTPVHHAVIAVAIQMAITYVFSDVLMGAAAGAAFFIGREHAQAEYRWIEWYGSSLRSSIPWWGGLDPRVWVKLDCWLDWIVPTIAVSCVVLLSRLV